MIAGDAVMPLEHQISNRTIAKLLGTGLLVYGALLLRQFALLLVMAALFAVTLDPLLKWLTSRRIPRWGGLALIIVSMLGVLLAFFGVLVPTIVSQLGEFVKTIPQLKINLHNRLPEHGFMSPLFEKALQNPYLAGPEPWLKHLAEISQLVLGGSTAMLLMLIFAIYLLVDGPRTYRWLVAFFAPSIHPKINETAREVSAVVSAYFGGQLLTSGLVVIYTYPLLRAFNVPAALTLAVLAGIFDVLPMIGFFMSAIPAVFLALTVSPTAAASVLVLYLLYHFFENYLIVPRIYGEKLRLSTLAVLLSLTVGDLLAGVFGAIAILPIVASYPIVERIWLTHVLRSSTLKRHAISITK